MKNKILLSTLLLVSSLLAGCASTITDELALAPVATPSPANAEIMQGQTFFLDGDYGLAEKSFRKAVELEPNSGEAWLGLAASYDRLRRFDLADRAYSMTLRISKNAPAVLNNIGYSYLLRGDYKSARIKLLAALELDPENPYIRNNIQFLDEQTSRPLGVRS